MNGQSRACLKSLLLAKSNVCEQTAGGDEEKTTENSMIISVKRYNFTFIYMYIHIKVRF